MEYSCRIENSPAQPTMGVRARTSVENLSVFLGEAYGAVIQYLESLGEDPAGPPFAVYYNMDMQDLDIEAGFPVSRAMSGEGDVQPGEIPGGPRAMVLHKGRYDDLGSAYQALTDFVNTSGSQPTGVAYEFYLKGPREHPPEELETLIVFPIRETEG